MLENPQRNGGIEIPERPAVASEAAADGRLRRRVLLWGGIAAAALVVLAVLASVFSGHGDRVARQDTEAPFIKGEKQPMKVAPDSPGGMQVPNRDMLVYERMKGTPGAPPVERLLPEPEQPMVPPQPKPAAPPAEPPLLVPPRDGDVVGVEQRSPVDKPSSPSDAGLPPEKPEQPPAAASSSSPNVATTTTAVPPPPSPPPARATVTEKPPSLPEKQAVPAKPAKTATGGYQVQLLAGRDEADVRSAWTKLKAQNSDLLGSLSPVLAPTRLGDRGTYYRLRAGPLENEAKARAVCDRLSRRGASCIVVRPGR